MLTQQNREGEQPLRDDPNLYNVLTSLNVLLHIPYCSIPNIFVESVLVLDMSVSEPTS